MGGRFPGGEAFEHIPKSMAQAYGGGPVGPKAVPPGAPGGGREPPRVKMPRLDPPGGAGNYAALPAELLALLVVGSAGTECAPQTPPIPSSEAPDQTRGSLGHAAEHVGPDPVSRLFR